MEKQVNQLQITVEQNLLSGEDKDSLVRIFNPYFEQADEWIAKAKDIIVTDANQVEVIAFARQARLALKAIRVEVNKTRKQLKEDGIRKGKAIEGIANVIKFLIEPIEDHLEKQEKFAEIQEKQKKVELKAERLKQLEPYEVEQVEFYDLENMNDDNFRTLLNNSMLLHEKKIELRNKEEADRIAAENARIAREEEIRKENERLKAERQAREKEIAAENERRDKEKKKLEAEAKKAEQARLAAEAELKAKEDAEKKKKALEKEQARQAKLAPEKDKLISLAIQLENVSYPAMDSVEGNDSLSMAKTKIQEVAHFIRSLAIKL
jgi:hypothetical protein